MNLKKILKDVFILCLITIICGGLMGYVYQITKKPIEKQAKQTQQEAYKLVMKKATGFKKYEDQKIKVRPGGSHVVRTVSGGITGFEKT